MAGIVLFLCGVLIGAIVPLYFPRQYYFLMWDGIVVFFTFMWVIHVATDLQRSDAITFDRILHLPVSFAEVFVINYLSTLASIHFICMSSACFGFILGSCYSIGPVAILISLPFVAFLMAVTSLTYQFQGWLATLMSNPRRRQFVMIIIPIVIVVFTQIPALITTFYAGRFSHRVEPQLSPPTVVIPSPAPPIETSEMSSPTLVEGETEGTSSQEGAETPEVAVQPQVQPAVEQRRQFAKFLEIVGWVNLVFPPLWMAGCVQSIVAGTWHVLWLTLTLVGVALLSLRRNYRQTLRFYLGETDSRAGANQDPNPQRAPEVVSKEALPVLSDRSQTKLTMIEWQIPLVHESTSAITTMTWQSMKRAPEAKIYLLLPFVAPFVMFGVLQSIGLSKIDELKAGIVVGFSALVLLILTGILGNQFGYDRSGFRAFVLSPIRRDRILLGRNLAASPVIVLQIFCLSLVIGVYFGMATDKIVAAILLSTSMLPPCLLLFNLMSILTPFPIAAGQMQPKHFDLVPVVLSVLLSMIMPIIALIAMLPLGLEWVIHNYLWKSTFPPIALLLSFLWFTGALLLYRFLLPYQGRLLSRREKELLRIVTSKIE